MRSVRKSLWQREVAEQDRQGLLAAITQASHVFPNEGSGHVSLSLAALHLYVLRDVQAAASILQKAKGAKCSLVSGAIDNTYLPMNFLKESKRENPDPTTPASQQQVSYHCLAAACANNSALAREGRQAEAQRSKREHYGLGDIRRVAREHQTTHRQPPVRGGVQNLIEHSDTRTK